MEANEQGLTKEEKIMFYILGIILIVALGVLTIKVFSDNERVLQEETPTKENDVQENNIENEKNNTSKSESSLIEVPTENNAKKITASYTASKNNSYIAAIPKDNIVASKPILSNKEEQESTNPVITSWNFNNNIVTEAYNGDKIIIDKSVILDNGEKGTAQVTVRKLIDDAYMIIDISSDYIIVTPGTYRYSYTYADITKELTLTVYDYIDNTNTSFLSIKDEIIDDSLENEYLESIKETINNSNLVIENNILNLTVNKTKTSSNILPLIINLENIVNENSTIKSKTTGITVTKENESWYQELLPEQVIVWLNLDMLKNSNIIINIDGTDYIIKINISIIDDSTENNEEDNKDPIEEDNNEEEKNPDEGPKTDEEVENDKNNIEENSELEPSVIASVATDTMIQDTSQ